MSGLRPFSISLACCSLLSGSAAAAPSDPLCFGQQAHLLPTVAWNNSQFGRSVDVWGDTAVVGANGYVDVHERGGSSWTWSTRIDGSTWEAFGHVVALQGDTLAVGAPGASPMGEDSGAVYVFERSGGVWLQAALLFPDDGAPDHQFGGRVALDGDTLLVADSADLQGSVHVYVRVGSVWSRQEVLRGSLASVAFGHSVALSGDRAVIGDPWDPTLGVQAGTAYVFERAGASWSLEEQLFAPGAASNDFFGWSAAISGETVLVGAYLQNYTGVAADVGSVHVYVRTGGSWNQEARLLPSDPLASDWFGYSVALDGDRALVGCPKDDSPFNSGSVYVFDRRGTSWEERPKLRGSAGTSMDELGRAVATHLGTAIGGAPLTGGASENTGSAYVWYAPPPVGTSYCHCHDGPCGNSEPTAGCKNSTGGGAHLTAQGTTLPDALNLLVGGARPGQFSIFFQGTTAVSFTFGDGFRCAGGAVVRITPLPVQIDGSGQAAYGPCFGDASISSITGAVPGSGDTLRYQFWYRDPGGPCGSNFNLSNGCEIVW